MKNYYLSNERSIKRKVKEALLAIKIDKEKSKDQILQDYLNTIYMGRGAYGVQAAAKAYFNTTVDKLTPAQGIVMASVIRAPSRYNPTDTESASDLKGRWGYVADAMVGTGALTPEQRRRLKFPAFPKQTKATSRYGGTSPSGPRSTPGWPRTRRLSAGRTRPGRRAGGAARSRGTGSSPAERRKCQTPSLAWRA